MFLMGLNRLPQIMERLVQTGAEEHTPVAVISKGTMPGQRIVRGDIQTIADKVNEAKLESPAIIVVGENAALDLLHRTEDHCRMFTLDLLERQSFARR